MNNSTFDWEKTGQLSPGQLLAAVFMPSGIACIGFHIVLPALVANGLPVMIAWPAVASAMLAVLVIIAVILLKKEARTLGISLRARMCLKRLSAREWRFYIVLMIAGLGVSLAAQALVPSFMQLFQLSVPEYMPFFLNPAIDPVTAEMSIISPGLPLPGQYSLLPLLGITLLLNILTEELYFRAWMLPKLSRYGSWAWMLNGIFFALYHIFQIWLLPTLLVSSLFFAFIFYKSRSIWPSFSAHLVMNFLLSILGILLLISRQA